MYSNKVIEQDANERKLREFWQDVKTYWHLYLGLGLTAVLTVFAGVYLGLAPASDGSIHYVDGWDAARHIFFAAYFGLMFFVVSEGAVLYAKARLFDRDVDEQGRDKTGQYVSMSVMLVVAVANVVVTAVVAGEILACWLGAFDNWVRIPDFAQGWVVMAPPVLIVFYSVMSLIYQHNSHRAELLRDVHRVTRLAQAQAQRAFADEYKRAYILHAPMFAQAAARASAQLDAQRWSGRAASPQLEAGAAPDEADEFDLEDDELPEQPDAGDLFDDAPAPEQVPIFAERTPLLASLPQRNAKRDGTQLTGGRG